MNSKVRNIPRAIQLNQSLIQEALEYGCIKAKVIKTESIVLAQWIRVQCQYGCSYFGKRFTCPPFTPLVDEVSDFLAEYQNAILIETKDSNNIHNIVLSLENSLKNQGYYKAFAFDSIVCDLCEVCNTESQCENPTKARPSIRAFGIDISATTLNNGWKPSFIPDYCNHNTLGLVLID